ncbi:MAG: methyltransferase domain-containing protein [Chitinophagaceae bacterium]|nr:methyltransferase domain-containing protein [Chitinophagaceae bacterium]
MFSNEDIERYYKLSETQYRWGWQLYKSRSLHYGLWDASTRNLHEALMNTNRRMAELAGITSQDHVLDAGCGIGGSSLWLGKNTGCRATGITLSARQVELATALSHKDGLTDRVHFEQKDYTATGFPDESFDVVWAVESVCHTQDKNDFVKEAWRVLKPGGRLIMADFFQQPGLTGADAQLMLDWAHGWTCDHFIELDRFNGFLLQAGFKVETEQDLTRAIWPSAKKIYRTYFPGVIAGRIYNLFHPKAHAFGMKNIATAKLQYITLKKGLWKYYFLLAVKG